MFTPSPTPSSDRSAARHATRSYAPDKVYAHVRYALRGYAYTAVQMELLGCPRCGYQLLEEHRLVARTARTARRCTLGRVRMCRRCHRESWLFTSHMPSILAGRERDAKVVL